MSAIRVRSRSAFLLMAVLVLSAAVLGADATAASRAPGGGGKPVMAVGGTPQWQMYGRDAQHTGRSANPGPATSSQKWSYALGQTVADSGGLAIGGDGTIYASTYHGLFAVNPNGTSKWSHFTGAFDAGQQIHTTPAVAADDSTVYVTSVGFGTALYALDTGDGHELWHYSVDHLTYSSPTIGTDGTIYFGARLTSGGNWFVLAINANGTLKWSYDSGSSAGIEPSVALGASGQVYAVQNPGRLIALDSTGSFLWDKSLLSDWVNPAVGPDGTIYLTDDSSGTVIIAVNPGDGSTKWTAPTTSQVHFNVASMSADGLTLYQGAGRRVYALNTANGAERWHADLPDATAIIVAGIAVSANGLLYVTSSSTGGGVDGLTALDASTGVAVWSWVIGATDAAPALATDGTLYAIGSDGSGHGVLYALRDNHAADVPAFRTVYRPSNGYWYTFPAPGKPLGATWWGISGDIPVPGHFNGMTASRDAQAVFRPSTGEWFVSPSGVGTWWGLPGDLPLQGDFDGDGKADIAVYRPSNGFWYIINSHDSSVTSTWWGISGDIPVPGDFDGDGKTDIAVIRPSNGYWYILRSSDSGVTATWWATSEDVPVVGDYDGDGKSDIAVYRPSNGYWYVIRSSDSVVTSTWWGVSGDIPEPGDYDADGKTDIAVYRPSNGYWYVRNSSTGSISSDWWGISGDIPMSLPYIIRNAYYP